MLLKITFIIGFIYYFIGEGATEGKVMRHNDSDWDGNVYHFWRFFVENAGILLAVLPLVYTLWGFWGIGLSFLTVSCGLGLYEMVYRHHCYGNWQKEKNSYWIVSFKGRKLIKIKHPRMIFWKILVSSSIIVIVFYLMLWN